MANRLFLLLSRSPDTCRLCSVVRSSQGESLGKGTQNLNNQSENRLASREKMCATRKCFSFKKARFHRCFSFPFIPFQKPLCKPLKISTIAIEL